MQLTAKIGAAVAALALSTTVAIAQDVSVTVNGQPASLNPPPIERSGRVFVPLRGVFERLGATVVYDNGQINAQGNGRSVALHIGSTQATVAGNAENLDVAPFIVGASTYVPLRFVAEALGAAVNWDNNNRMVAIVQGNAGGPPNEVIPPQQNRPAPRAPQPSSISLSRMNPGADSLIPASRPRITATFANGNADPNSIRVRLDNSDVTADTTRSPNGVAFVPNANLAPERHNVRVTGRDDNGRPFDLRWSFTSGTNRESYNR